MVDHHVDRPEVEREQSPQLTGTNRSDRLDPQAPPPACSAKPPVLARGRPTRPQTLLDTLPPHLTPKGGFAGLVAIARGQTPDPIPNSAVKTLSAHGTASIEAEE